MVRVQFTSSLPWVRFALVRLNLNPVLGIVELSRVLCTELRYVLEIPVKLEAGNSRGDVAEAVVYRLAWEYVKLNAVRVPFIGSAIGMIPVLVLDVGAFAYDCELGGIAARAEVRRRTNVAKERTK